MSMLVATGSVARITGPLWGTQVLYTEEHACMLHLLGNQVYLLADRRTWLLMLILTVMQLVVVIGFVLLYRKMAPNKVYIHYIQQQQLVTIGVFIRTTPLLLRARRRTE